MKNIAIYGAGGLGREIACLIRHINEYSPTWNLTGFFDDGKAKGSSNEYGMILGGMDDLNAYSTPLDVVMAIGAPQTVHKLTEKIINPNIDFPNLIAPDTLFLDKESLTIGKGNVFCSRCFVSIATKIGDFNLLNGYITLGHDVTIGNYNAFMPAVRISGEVSIGDENFFGVSSVVLQCISIGKNTVIGANSTITRKTESNATYVGSPGRKTEIPFTTQINLKQFIRNFAEQFDETDMDISVFQENTVFKELNIWSSMVALSVIVMIDDIYDVHIGGHEIMTADTIEELFNTVKNILSEQ